MRIYKDVEMVEQLGSGIPRILKSYSKKCFKFSANFLRMSFPATPQVTPQDKGLKISDKDKFTPQVTPQVKSLLSALVGELDRRELQEKLKLSDRENFRISYLQPALEQGLIEMTIPDKPSSSLQKYRLTVLGEELKKR